MISTWCLKLVRKLMTAKTVLTTGDSFKTATQLNCFIIVFIVSVTVSWRFKLMSPNEKSIVEDFRLCVFCIVLLLLDSHWRRKRVNCGDEVQFLTKWRLYETSLFIKRNIDRLVRKKLNIISKFVTEYFTILQNAYH